MTDPVYDAFLGTAAEEALEAVAASDILTLHPTGTRTPPDTYEGTLRDVEHLVREGDGTVAVSRQTIDFTLHFPPDYCRSTDNRLTFRVAKSHSPLFHPNAWGEIICLGANFQPGTRLWSLVLQVHLIVSGRVFAAKDSLDLEATRYYLTHVEQIGALRARPLWRRQVVGRAQLDFAPVRHGGGAP